jgi:hypothetical protein
VATRKQLNEEEGKSNCQHGNQRGSVGVIHKCKIKIIHNSSLMVQHEALAVAKSLGCLQDGSIVLRRGTILCGMESVGNLKMWMKV